jgi:hypothetical protein
MFKGVSQCIPTVSVFYFGPFNSFHYFPYPFTYHHPFSTAFNTYLYTLYLHRCSVLQYHWCSIIPFSFPSFPKFHRVVPLLQTCFTYEFLSDHVCFGIYVYLFAIVTIPSKFVLWNNQMLLLDDIFTHTIPFLAKDIKSKNNKK